MLDLLRSQVAVLLRFRQFSLPINGDIEKIYHQVQVPAKSQYSLRFLYPAPGINEPCVSNDATCFCCRLITDDLYEFLCLKKTKKKEKQRKSKNRHPDIQFISPPILPSI
jgi:hypothetical protein